MSIQKGDIVRLLYQGDIPVKLEEECVLPDYCPDAVRLLRVEATPVVEKCRASIEDSALSVEVSGAVCYNLLYTEGDRGCESYSFSKEFTSVFKKEINGEHVDPDSLYASLVHSSSSVSSKVMSPRRIYCSSQSLFALTVFSNVSYSAYDPTHDIAEGMVDADVFTQGITAVTGQKSEGFSLSEEIKLPASMPSVERILSSSASLSIDSSHPSSDEVAVFATLYASITYLSEEGEERGEEALSVCQPIEIRNTLRIDDASESSICRVRASVGALTCRAIPDNYGEMRVISVTAPYTLSCLVMEKMDTSLVKDAYGIGNDAVCCEQSLELLEHLGTLTDSTAFRQKLVSKCDFDAVVGTRAEAVFRSAGYSPDEGAWVDMRLEVSALGQRDGIFEGAISKSVDMRLEFNLPDSILRRLDADNFLADVILTPVCVECQVSKGGVEVSGDIQTVAQIWVKKNARYVASVECGEKQSSSRGAIFYYPTEDDDLWSVGKRYGVSRDSIRRENKMERDALPDVCRIPHK